MSGTVSGGVDETSSDSHHGPGSERGWVPLVAVSSSAGVALLQRMSVPELPAPTSR